MWTLNKIKEINLTDLGIVSFLIYIFLQRWFVYYFRSGMLQLVFILILLFFILYDSRIRKSRVIEFSKIDLFWLFGIGIITVYIFMAGYKDYTIDLFFYVSGLAFLLFAKVDIKKFELAFSFIVVVTLVYALATIAQYYFTDSFNQMIFNFTTTMTQERIVHVIQRGYYPGLGFGRTGVAAGYIAVGIGLVAFNWEFKNKKQFLFDALIMLILLVGIVISGKRSVLLWMTVATSFVYISLGTGKEMLSRLIKMTALLFLIMFLLIFLFQFYDSVAPLSRIEVIYRALEAGDGISGDKDIRGRFALFQAAWKLFLDSPIFGVGWDQFRVLTSGLLKSDYLAHNIYLQLLSEVGIIGFLAVVVPLFYTYTITIISLSKLKMQPHGQDTLWFKGLTFSLYYQTYFLLMGLSENYFYMLIPMMLYFFSIAIINVYLISAGNIYLNLDITKMVRSTISFQDTDYNK